ncbi:MAG: SPFH/Band 7/PHB domain protein [Cyanobacteria bacterium J055]|nr:MAG: SPFH/Band 7/PHB domain protein [Cyanobacteria bacterium J055]
MESFFAALILLATGYCAGGVRIINQSNQALVERLGKYNKTLNPGVNWVAPILDTIVWEDTLREQLIDTGEHQAFTKDSVSLKIKAVVYWKILDLQMAYYAVDNVQEAIKNRVITAMSAEIGRLDLGRAVSARDDINKAILRQLDDETDGWGIKVTRIDVQDLKPSDSVIASMELESDAESKKKAEIAQAQGTAGYLREIARALSTEDQPPTSQEMLHFLLTDRYVEALQELGKSDNTKIVFMDPKALNEAMEPVFGEEIGKMSAKVRPINGGGKAGGSGEASA